MPQDFLQLGNDYYLISDEEMPWLQAQYDCMNRQGKGCALSIVISLPTIALSCT